MQSKQNSITSLKDVSFILTLFLSLPLMSKNKKLKILFEVFVATIKNSVNILVGLIGISVAFIFVGTLLFEDTDSFATPLQTSISIFCLMTGDSILDILQDLRHFSYYGLLYIVSVILYFVFFFQSLYVSLITDSYFMIIEEKVEDECLHIKTHVEYDEGEDDKKLLDFLEKMKNELKSK